MGLSKTAVVERALDQLADAAATVPGKRTRMLALLAQLDRVPERQLAFDPLEWDEHGLPLLFKGNDFSQTDIACAYGQTAF
jgi:antitoxin VapB